MVSSRVGLIGWLALGLGCGPSSTTSHEGSAGSSTEDGDGDEETDEDDPCKCGCVQILNNPHPPRIMFVVDASSSMATAWDHDGDPATPTQTRWASAHALVSWIADSWDPGALLGLTRFPSEDACPDATPMSPTCEDPSACSIADAPEHPLQWFGLGSLLAAIPGPDAAIDELAGGSPAAAAYASAVEHMLAMHDDHTSLELIVLLTDGHANCGDALEPPASLDVLDDDLLVLIAAAFDDHAIQTVIVAVDEDAAPSLEPDNDRIPGFDPRPALSQWALAGGLAQPPDNYLRASDPEVVHSLLDRPESNGGCWFDLTMTDVGPPSAAQVPLVTWTLDGEPLPLLDADSCATQSGWTWVANAEGEIGEWFELLWRGL